MDMKKLLDLITRTMEDAFDDLGYEKSYARVTVSNRPDLCEFQCNGAMALAKQEKKAPIQIAEQIAEKLAGNDLFDGFQAMYLITGIDSFRRISDFEVNSTL